MCGNVHRVTAAEISTSQLVTNSADDGDSFLVQFFRLTSRNYRCAVDTAAAATVITTTTTASCHSTDTERPHLCRNLQNKPGREYVTHAGNAMYSITGWVMLLNPLKIVPSPGGIRTPTTWFLGPNTAQTVSQAVQVQVFCWGLAAGYQPRPQLLTFVDFCVSLCAVASG